MTGRREWLDSTDCFINYENHYRYNASGTPSIDITLEKCVQEKPILIYKNL